MFVFDYLSHHLEKEPFSHLVVILYTMTDFSMNCQGKILQFNEIGMFSF